jgi:integrase
MDIRTSVFWRDAREKKTNRKAPDGSQIMAKVKGSYVFRIRYTDQDGKQCCRERGGFGKGEKNRCKDEMNRMVREIEQSGGHYITGERMTFNQLADRCLKEFYKPAVIRDGKKIAGIKSWKTVAAQVERLRRYFGNRPVGSITTDSLFGYREYRMKPQSPKKPGGLARHLKAATINRELAAMRRMMRYAHGNGWITRDIFYNAKVIQVSLEEPRDRILSSSEETRLLAACTGTWSKPYKRTRQGKTETLTATFSHDSWHLRALIILAVDTGMRKGELLKLKWQDIDFERGFVRVVSTNTKTERGRVVPLSARAVRELEAVRHLQGGGQSDRPFPFLDVRGSFATAKRLAGIDGLRFHDLRTTAGDRMSKVYPLSTVAKILGHTQLQTTMKYYVGNEMDAILDVKQWLDQRHHSAMVTSVEK